MNIIDKYEKIKHMNRIIRLKKVNSTNEYLKELTKTNIKSGTCVIALEQINGKGSNERNFLSPKGGLYLSYLLKVKTDPRSTIEVTKWVAVCVYKVITNYLKINVQIKHINDILFNGKKICGILVELRNDNLIIGIGINCNTDIEEFPTELKSTATSIKNETKKEVNINKLTNKLIKELNKMAKKWPDDKSYLDIYNKLIAS